MFFCMFTCKICRCTLFVLVCSCIFDNAANQLYPRRVSDKLMHEIAVHVKHITYVELTNKININVNLIYVMPKSNRYG